jgi:cytoskeletal protein CcmA (bactofilin family)
MFGKEEDTTTAQGSLNSILGHGCKVKGDIELQGTIRIDGEFDGSIACPDTLIIGKSGILKAEVKVKNAVIGGKLIGNIHASNKIELQSGSHVQGDIETGRLVIDEGVFFEGNCKMGGKARTGEDTPSAIATKPEKGWKAEEKKPETAHSR